ncbi:hypothetical protein LCGC14_1320000 [marine sediment metagenome]|uniref:Uncharacterized protein n=1 Tax=marine sediment metagenome TaxID=412755 RepID=A0A0F9L525_9ZZZZ
MKLLTVLFVILTLSACISVHPPDSCSRTSHVWDNSCRGECGGKK